MKINLIEGEIFNLLENHKIKETFDFIFIDAIQSKYKQLVKKLQKEKIFNKDTILIFDNAKSHNMEDFSKYLKENFIYTLSNVDKGFFVAKLKQDTTI